MEQTPKPTDAPKPKSMKSMYAIVGAVVVIVVIVLGLYFADVFNTTPPPPGTPATIYGNGTYSTCSGVTNCGYDQSPITIAHGVKITWTNNSTSTPHTVTECISGSDSGSCPNKDATTLSPAFDSGTSGLTSGQTYSYTFASAGHYYYYCQFHSGMHGEVIVT